jgi:hypothetical protein
MTITFQSATSSRSSTRIDLSYIFWKGVNLPKDIVNILGFPHSVGGKKPVIQKSASDVIGDANKPLKRVEVRFKFNGLAVVREHNVTLSGKVPWEMMYRILARLVPEVKSLTFTITNTAVRFYLKRHVFLERIINERTKGANYSMEYEPEMGFSRLLIRFNDGVVASIFANGTVVAQGKNLTGIETRIKNIFATYKNPYGPEKKTVPIAARKNLAAKRAAMTEGRYNRASTWNSVRTGFYVRPGPNKISRFYPIPSNPALVRQKVIRAYANVGVNIPERTKTLLGIKSNMKLKPKVVTRKVLNWNANAPNGMYVRPGPGGLPKLYKIPKMISHGKKTVVTAYKKAGVNIPNRVKHIFGINKAPSPLNKTNLRINRGVLKIGKLTCMRYKLDELKKIATKYNIPVIRQTKAALCKELQKKVKSSTPKSPNFTLNGIKHYIVSNERRIIRNTRSKIMNSFKIDELKHMVKELNASIDLSSKMTKKQLIDIILERKRMKNVIRNMNFNFSASSSNSSSASSSASNTSPVRSAASNNSPVRSGVDIARNILGPGFTNTELQNFLNRYMKSPGRKNQIINEFKRKKMTRMARAPVEVM